MKKNLLIILIITITNTYSQTKKETYEYLNEKIGIYKLEKPNLKYYYLIQEVVIDNKEHINFLDFCTVGSITPLVTVYFFEPKDYTAIVNKDKSESIWIEIYCKYNSIERQDVDFKTKERTQKKPTSKIEIVLGNDTPPEVINKIEKAFIHLLKLYGVEKKEKF
jgi:hypothetical protein